MRQLRCATRRSALALAQCRSLLGRLALGDGGLDIEELHVVTSGDKILDRPLADVGGKGLFVKEIEEALLDGRADFAVHSMKDVPVALSPGLVIAAIPAREDPRDAVISPRYGSLGALPSGARVGTSSERRSVTLRALRPDLDPVPVRGNVDTRLAKVDRGDFDAIVVARAGLIRLGLEARVTEILEPEIFLPAVGQGALGVECRAVDASTVSLLLRLHDSESAIRVDAERGVLAAVGGDCRTPLGAYAERVGNSLNLRAWVAVGSIIRRAESRVPWPDARADAEQIGEQLGKRLLG
jgi:hydroxymethylbilane synthase